MAVPFDSTASTGDHSSLPLETLERGLIELIGQNVLEGCDRLGPQSNLFDAGLDSMAIMQLLLLIEDRYGIMLAAADLTRENFATARVLAKLVQRRLGERESGGDG